jgi:hypothetical protein
VIGEDPRMTPRGRVLGFSVLACLVACETSSDDRLTSHGHRVECDVTTQRVDYTGIFTFEWMCFGQSNQPDCDPTENPMLDSTSIRIEAPVGTDRRVSLGGSFWFAMENPEGSWLTFPPGTDVGQLRRGGHTYGCLDGRIGMDIAWDTRDGGAYTEWTAELRRQ